MPAIYAITNIVTNQKYIGKTINPKERWWAHKYAMTRDVYPKDCNRHLFNSAKKYGILNFIFEILEQFDDIDDKCLSDRELYWMDFYKSCNRKFGFNLRRDSSTKCTVSDETRIMLKIAHKGENNGNYGNRWTLEQKQRMSEIAKTRHTSGLYYGESWKIANSIASKKTWSDLAKRNAMAKNVKLAKRKYIFDQFTREGVFIKTWLSVDEIIFFNPTWKWQNIYSVCNGYKPTYMNFKWSKREK